MVARMDVYEAFEKRRSVRGFRPDPIEPAVLRRILEGAQRAPSWCNIQPWRVWLTSGAATQKLTTSLTQAAQSSMPHPEFPFPLAYPEPYDALRKECGIALYKAMGIARDDKQGRFGAWMRNYAAFDAPHIAIVGIDKRFGIYAALDVGCWLEALLLAATAEGVSACAQASLGAYADVVHRVLEIPEEVGVLFGISLGYEDPNVPANACRTDRNPIEANVRFVDT